VRQRDCGLPRNSVRNQEKHCCTLPWIEGVRRPLDFGVFYAKIFDTGMSTLEILGIITFPIVLTGLVVWGRLHL